MDELLEFLGPHAQPDAAAEIPRQDGNIVVIGGMGGIGKSALAQSAAAQAAERGHFPGGAYLTNLRGYEADSSAMVWPVRLYASILRQLGVDPDSVPADCGEQATILHAVLAARDRANLATLFIFDNVSNADQVVGLLPDAGSVHRVIITTRDRVPRFSEFRRLELYEMDSKSAVQLLAAEIRRTVPIDCRVAEDPGNAARIASMCSGLPLAVKIIGAILADEPDRTLFEMVIELRDESNRLEVLDRADGGAVTLAFELSHRRLSQRTSRVFRSVAAAPGADFSAETAAVLAGIEERQALNDLRGLRDSYLVEYSDGKRWRMHDLARIFAQGMLSPDDLKEASGRLFAHFRAVAHLAQITFTDQIHLPRDPRFSSAAEAEAWIRNEKQGMIAMLLRRRATEPDSVIAIVSELVPFMDWGRHWDEWLTITAASVEAASYVSNPYNIGVAYVNYGIALRRTGRLEESIEAHRVAGKEFAKAGDVVAVGDNTGSMGLVLRDLGRFEEAIAELNRALSIARVTHRVTAEAKLLNGIGLTFYASGRYDEAIAAHCRARDMFFELGDRRGESVSWNNLGHALRKAGRPSSARLAHKRARKCAEIAEDIHIQLDAMRALAVALGDEGRSQDAAVVLLAVAERTQSLNEPAKAADNWMRAGDILIRLGRFDEAVAAYERGAQLFNDLERFADAGYARLLVAQVYLNSNSTALFDLALEEASDLLSRTGNAEDLRKVELLRRLSVKRLTDGAANNDSA